ncbi:hypothetical protein PROFUN_04299 [Planoprotostelium fungivorum]|uniref:alpha-mannosidase n=1 Tax=Planoprotostelium fungivorum TaxID=1890364 RepID=A0A2P6NV40_9EUKA|nr:hypothetical protein PROFUN_04299 [Planoprotostelium fungivorum]
MFNSILVWAAVPKLEFRRESGGTKRNRDVYRLPIPIYLDLEIIRPVVSTNGGWHDVGWILPWETYYETQVRYILDSTTEALFSHAERKFNQVEILYFRHWWSLSNDTTREKMRTIISRGQLEFNTGGMTMNDEACTLYSDQINQMTEGHRWLHDTFGVIPTTSWHVDPFGHSSTTASLWSLMGFYAYAIHRIPSQNMDRGAMGDAGSHTDLWTHIIAPLYDTPAEMRFDLMDQGHTIRSIAALTAQMIRSQQVSYRHNYQMVLWGGDFYHRDAPTDYNLMDRLIREINDTPDYNMTLQYGFYSDYAKAVHSLNLTWDVVEGDFFPYVEDTHVAWTGFYSSRPWFKWYVRQCGALQAAAETFVAVRRWDDETYEKLEAALYRLREATAVVTHHDAITGTETTATMLDYIVNLQSAVNQTTLALSQTISSETREGNHTLGVVQYAVINSLAWRRKEWISMETEYPDAIVRNDKGRRIPSQGKKYRLYFLADVPPLSTMIYSFLFLSVPSKSVKGRLKSLTDITRGDSIEISLEFAQYLSSDLDPQSDGAYIFRPQRQLDVNSVYIHSAATLSEREFTIEKASIDSVADREIVSLWVGQFSSKFPHVHVEVDSSRFQSSDVRQYNEHTVKFSRPFDREPVVVVDGRQGNYFHVLLVLVSVTRYNFTVRTDRPIWPGDAGIEVTYVAVEPIHHVSKFENFILAGKRLAGDIVEHPPINTACPILMSPFYNEPKGMAELAVDKERNTTSFRGLARKLDDNQGDVWYYYIMLPSPPPLIEILSDVPNVTVVDGPYLREVQQTHRSYVGITYLEYKPIPNTYAPPPFTDISCEIGPLPKSGRDLIVRLNTSLHTNGNIYTDDNGLEVLKRSYTCGHPEPESVNYYPTAQRRVVDGENLNVLSDASHGVASLSDGQMEMMMHRRCDADDQKGVGQVLDDVTPVQTKLRLSLGNFDESSRIQRRETIAQQNRLVVVPTFRGKSSSFQFEMPENVHLLTLMRFDDEKNVRVLVRLQHIYAKDEHPQLASPVEMDLMELFDMYDIASIRETNLSGIRGIEETKDIVWKVNRDEETAYRPIELKGNKLTLQPMEIRTFIITLT